KWESVIDSQGVKDAEEARSRALGELQNASMEWQRAEGQEEEKNPSIMNPQWKNADGQSITKALVGDEVLLCADVQDIADGTSAKIKIVEKDANGNDDDVATLNATVKDGKIECAWKVIYIEDDDDADSEQEKAEKGYTLPEYAFTVECDGVTSGESGRLEIKDEIIITVKNFEKLKGKTLKLVWRDGSSKTVTIDSQKIIVKDIFIGSASIKIM
ncbi:MAG: hypothetical protein NC489_29470, partial [Ruminococcus flavefaciens]|nr:hypothetical protein [Ruminococcus flavefaciens]